MGDRVGDLGWETGSGNPGMGGGFGGGKGPGGSGVVSGRAEGGERGLGDPGVRGRSEPGWVGGPGSGWMAGPELGRESGHVRDPVPGSALGKAGWGSVWVRVPGPIRTGAGASGGGPRSPSHLDGVEEPGEAEAAQPPHRAPQQRIEHRPEHVVPGLRVGAGLGGGPIPFGGLQWDGHVRLPGLHQRE